MADNQMDSVEQKTANLNLSAKAKAFTPKFNTKAPAFVPNPKPAVAPAATPSPAPAAPKKGEAKPSKPSTALEPVREESVDAEDELLLDEHFKEHLNVIFIGHVDAGKSTLGGNILYLTGMVDKRTMEKYEREAKEAGRESWYLSWALDTNQEERAKGKTVECGRASFETTKRRYTILDAPGHKNFVPSMLGGAAQADVGVLVISARKGEFETGFERGGQTREHAILAKTAGVRKLIVVINKMDDPTVEWDKARYDEILTKLSPFLKKSGYNPKTDLIFIPISGFTGAGVKDRVNAKQCKWYSGPSLLETLDNMQAIERKINGPLRIPIGEKYGDMGTIISGKIESGHVKNNQKVMVSPGKKMCEISAIYGENDDEVEMAVCGDNVRIKLRGIKEDMMSVGNVLTDTKNPCHSTYAFEAQLAILDVKNILTAGYSSVLHAHTAVVEVRLTKLLHKLNRQGQKSRMPPPFVKKDDMCIVRIETTGRPVCVEKFKDYPQLGRFTLRDEGKTIAVGKILRLVKRAPTDGKPGAAAAAAGAPAAN